MPFEGHVDGLFHSDSGNRMMYMLMSSSPTFLCQTVAMRTL